MTTVLQLSDVEESRASTARYLIASLTKSTLTSTETALEKLLNASTGLGRFVLTTTAASLLGDRVPNEDKVALLKSLVAKACEKENAITLLADMFESTNATSAVQSVDKLHEFVSKTLPLTRAQQVLVAAAVTFSVNDSWRDTAGQVLVRLLERGTAEDIKALFPTNNGIQMGMVLAQIPALRKLSEDLSSVPVPVDTVLPYEESFSIAKVVEELGTVCISSLEDCKELLSMFPAPLSDKVVAELLCLLACPSTCSAPSDTNAYNSLRVSVGLSESKTSNAAAPPQTNIVVQALKELSGGKTDINAVRDQWNRYLLALDQPNIRVERFSTIAAAYKKGTNEQLPIILFINSNVRKWKNTSIQTAALKFALDNPELVGKDSVAIGKARRVPADIPAPDDLSDLWRIESFVDTIAYVSARERDLDVSLTNAINKAPAVIFTALLACPAPTVRHYVLAAQTLKSASNLGNVVLPSAVQFLTAEGCIGALVGLLSELASSDTTRVFEIAELAVRVGITDAVLKFSSSTRLVVETAICAKESGAMPDKWFDEALSDSNRARPNQPHSKFAVAASILEAADDLIVRQRHVQAATQALQALVANPSVAAALPGVAAHAKVLIQGDHAFTADVEEEATQFFTRIYSDDTIAPMSLIDRLHRSGNPREKQVLNCIIHILFEETRSLADYPWKQLQTAARLYGQLIASDILGPARLQKALMLLLPTILKQTDMKTYEYGIIALEQFKANLLEWPAVGKQLKTVADLDMRIPGIIGIINQGIQKAANEEAAAAAGDAASATGAGAGTGSGEGGAATGAPGLHQFDIRILMDKSNSHPVPPPVVQDQINFLVGNTDPSNLDTNALELVLLIKPEFYSFFADYLVIKRVSLEPNFHRMYLQLLDKINNREIEKRVRLATVGAVKRLLNSDKIRSDTSERSLLKNLGSWFGCITLAKNIPVLSRDVDFKEMLYTGLKEGKLIAVVPFIAKVLEQCVNSRYFRPPNPWTIAQLGHLYEMYRLPDLKLTLRFEVEVLCKNINITVAEVEDFMRSMYPMGRRGLTMSDIRSQLDISGSTDFRVEEPRHESPAPKPRGLQADAAPYQPRTLTSTVEPLPPPRPPVQITPETVRVGDELRFLPAARHQAYHQALVKTLEPALKEVQAHVERAAVIAAYSAREIVVKDFARDPDPNLLRRAGQAMARSLASNLCTAIVKEHLWTALRKHLLVLASHLNENPTTRQEITESVANNNFDLCVRFLEYQSNDLAGRKTEEFLKSIVDEKTNALRSGEPLPFPADQVNLQPLLSTLPEALRPSGMMPSAQRAVYEEFFMCVPVIEQLSHYIRTIEEAALRHYQTPQAEVLSLTNPQFTEKQLSEHHVVIRSKLVDVAHLVTAETAPQLIGFVVNRLMDITENLTRIDVSRAETKPLVSTTQLLNEVLLFVIQSANEKGKEKSLAELTRCYLAHERRWKYCDVIVNFMRLRVIEVPKFDEALSKALEDKQATRNIVEFAGQVIQKVLIDDKLATTRDLHQTLTMLEQIARARSAQAQQQQTQQQQAGIGQQQSAAAVPPAQGPQPVAPAALKPAVAPTAPQPAAMSPQPTKTPAGVAASPALQSPYPASARFIVVKSQHPSDRRADIEQLFEEWISICVKKAQLALDPAAASSAPNDSEVTQQMSMQFVKKLQQTNMLLTDRNQLDSFIGILIELSVEHYATVALEQERSQGGVQQPTPLTRGAAPPHRFPFCGELFLKCDAFSDLVVLLVRCCSWSQTSQGAQSSESTARAEVALVGRVLQVTMKALQNNHEMIQTNQADTLPPLTNRPDAVYQRVFLQQPYVRILSNLLIAIHRNHGDSVPSQPTEPTTTTEEILRFFSDALRGTTPLRAPAFAFGWLECVSHRLFVVRMLKNKKLWPNYATLLCEALKFVEFFTKGSSGVPSNVLVFVKAFLKLMLILLHDFPEFVLSWHVQLCDAIPACCVQLRNVVLCAFPQNIKLPDPFGQNLHIDRLPEMSQAPPTQEHYRRQLFQNTSVSLDDIAAFVSSRQAPNSTQFARAALEAVRNTNGRWNVPLINAVVLHTACTHLSLTSQTVPPNFVDSPALELFREFARGLDTEGRYYFLNACANHLRYPNSHTHYFSQVLLHLFLPTSPQHVAQLAQLQEVIQEQITRVLVERLIISRPHPWGLLITFIELIKNKRYGFWEKSFIRCTPEIEKMFDSLLKSISGSSAAAAAASGAAAPTPAQ